MIGSVAYIGLTFILHGYAADSVLSDYAFESSKTDRNRGFYVSVALRWGSSASASYEITSQYGFVFGDAFISRTDRSFTPLFFTDETDIVAAADANLKTGYKSCSLASSVSDTDIGAYHVELTLASGAQGGDIWDSAAELEEIYLIEYGHVYPAYIDGVRCVRIGAFPTYTEASSAAAAIAAGLDGFSVSVASPSSGGPAFLNEDYDRIIFGLSGAENHLGGVAARQRDGAERSYLCNTLNSYLYDGVFCFRRNQTSEYNNLTFINLVGMKEYSEGVLPAEIFTSWPREALGAFAVTVNSFAITGLNKRFSVYGCDYIASSADENYSGRHGVNDAVVQACAEAKEMVLTYGSEVVGGAYSSSQGGCSVDTQYVWGGITGPYICSQPTPWEDYSTITRGLWFKEVSPTELATQLKSYNSSLVSGTSITDVSYEITGDSTYVYSLTVTDNKGKKSTITKTSTVNAAMGSYTYSANFVIGKNSVEYTYDKVLETKIIDLRQNYSGNLSVKTSDGVVNSTASTFNFFTSLGKALKDSSKSLYVMTSSGTAVLASETDIPVTTFPDSNGYYTYVSDYGDFLIVTRLQQITGVHRASKSGSYAIVGKGFGHGVGMSQYGVYFLAKAGATYDQILTAYYPGTKVENVYDFWARN